MALAQKSLTTRRGFLAGANATLLASRPSLAQTGAKPMRIRCTFADQDFTSLLQNSATTRDFVSMLPLDLTISDFSTNEKNAHLPRRLNEGGLVDYDDGHGSQKVQKTARGAVFPTNAHQPISRRMRL